MKYQILARVRHYDIGTVNSPYMEVKEFDTDEDAIAFADKISKWYEFTMYKLHVGKPSELVFVNTIPEARGKPTERKMTFFDNLFGLLCLSGVLLSLGLFVYKLVEVIF